MLARRTLIAPAAAITAVVALGLGLLPTGATAAPAPSVDAAFTPTLTYVPCPVGEELPPRTRCASLRVPLDWQTPDDGRTIQIAMRVTTPRRDAGRMGLTWNNGGDPANAFATDQNGIEVGVTFFFGGAPRVRTVATAPASLATPTAP
jgi:hypothetical protein